MDCDIQTSNHYNVSAGRVECTGDDGRGGAHTTASPHSGGSRTLQPKYSHQPLRQERQESTKKRKFFNAFLAALEKSADVLPVTAIGRH